MRARKICVGMIPLIGLTGALSTGTASAAAVYAGNGATGFDGAVGTGNLAISDTTAGLTITFNRGGGSFNDALDLFVDTQPGGFNNTAGFDDGGDPGRNALSSFGAEVTFPSGFGADYGISIENGFIGVFQLESGAPFNYLFGQGQSGNATDASYSITITPAELNQIGINNVGQSFGFIGTYISTSDYRSNETIGVTSPDISTGGNPGNPSSISFSTAEIYTTTAVPEPASIALLAVGGLSLIARRRRAV